MMNTQTADIAARATGPAHPGGLRAQGRRVSRRRIGTREEWTAAREALLVREKAHTQAGRRARPRAA